MQFCYFSLRAAISNVYTHGCGSIPIKLYFKVRQWATFGPWTIDCWSLSQMIISINNNQATQVIAQWGDYVLQISWEILDWIAVLSKADWMHGKPLSWGLRYRAWAMETIGDYRLPQCSGQYIHGPCFLQVQPMAISSLPVLGSFFWKTQPGDEFMVPFAHLLVAVLGYS